MTELEKIRKEINDLHLAYATTFPATMSTEEYHQKLEALTAEEVNATLKELGLWADV